MDGVAPSSSYARDAGGPRSRSSVSACPGVSPATVTTNRRGVAPTDTPPCVSAWSFT